MKFLDEAKVYLKAGNGGAGAISFRREKFIEFGGPDGGDGGDGGNIYIEAVPGLNTLIDFRYQQHFKAGVGNHGAGSQRTGARGHDIILKVPVGTQVFYDDKQTLFVDLIEVGQRVTLAKGGMGGRGNIRFKSSVNQAPTRADTGIPGEELWIWLKLKLIADVGLLGLPNAGKSTFLSVVSRAKPKIANYPFTTLHPQLGVVSIHEQEFVIADIPGLIEGAHLGTGLGHRFLGHIERCRVLLHLIDITQDDPILAYQTIRHEVSQYAQALAVKPEIIAFTKIDALEADEAAKKLKKFKSKFKNNPAVQDIRLISSHTRHGVSDLLDHLLTIVKA